ncbi:GNAT family N-acetyltransferase [Sphingomonas baiyangensis]|uniref:GNAT family N-acetyltransferase n=1 Tax=Sphingomonas baiyangensis TaxID=2572576 RepID=A0A4U1L313_9SPHN|nr:GNAT family N-acetyltransferase [Sphingomonas baiyangensis]TKD51269.1 GNAT family N-acetyltransferase [Sphingomonas baiyangensis]
MGLTPVPPGHVAAVVTALTMTERPRPRPFPDAPLSLVRWQAPPSDRYRTLFARVGAPWLWFSRLAMDEAQLRAILDDRDVAVFAATDRKGVEVGMLELDFRTAGEGLIQYFGLVPELTGRGHGRWLMAHALAQGWREGVERMRVNTCTLDHPHALGFYRAQGFAVESRVIETFADPRLTGLLPPDAAPQIPLLSRR